jgi:hypothetical protein
MSLSIEMVPQSDEAIFYGLDVGAMVANKHNKKGLGSLEVISRIC